MNELCEPQIKFHIINPYLKLANFFSTTTAEAAAAAAAVAAATAEKKQ